MTTTPAAAGVTIRGLTKVFGDRPVVQQLDLSISPGELVSLLGPSGCGKTTTLRMMAGFLTADRGTIEIDGRDVTALSPDQRPSAMVFQNYALWPHMSVYKNIAYPLRLRRLPRPEIDTRVSRVLELVSLTHHRHSRPATISGGEQQRVALARALVQEPRVLLLDEPLSNLDAKLRVKVREDIRTLQQTLGITTLLVTHDQDEALSMSDRIAVMNGGRIEQYSAPDELYSTPHTEFVASFVGSLNRLPGRLTPSGVVADSVTTAIRPEDVLLCGEEDPAAQLTGVVSQVMPRGHFHEIAVSVSEELTLRSFQSGISLKVGERVGVRIRRSMVYRDGLLETVQTAAL